MENTIRLDCAVCERQIEKSRNRAKQLITDGKIYVNGKQITKPSFSVLEEDIIELKGEKLKYVGRGGLKLEKAITEFNINLNKKICIDIGASTGGFTDCMLQNGADKVYAVDVGSSQLDSKLRNDKRVIAIENTDARKLNFDIIPEKCNFASFDVSFISVTMLIYGILPFLSNGADIIVLVKPQFEAGRENVSKNGIVSSKKAHKAVLEKIYDYCIQTKLSIIDVCNSPIHGGEGNIEYLFHIKNQQNKSISKSELDKLVL